MADSLQYILYNAYAYTIVLLFLYKWRGFSVGLFLWGIYTVSSWCSYWFYSNPLTPVLLDKLYNPQTPFAFIYLFVVLFLFIQPLTKIRHFDIRNLNLDLYIRKLKPFLIFIIIYQIIYVIVDSSIIINILSSGERMLADFRSNVYESTNSNMQKIRYIRNFYGIYNGIKPLIYAIALILFVFHKNAKDKMFVRVLFTTTILDVVREVVVVVSRGILANYLFLSFGIFLIFWKNLSYKARRTLLIYVTPILVVSIVFLQAISVSRFDDLATLYLSRYLGESMTNFNGILFSDLKGIAGGHAYFNRIFELFNIKDYVTAIQKWDFIEKVTGLEGGIFYTFVGSLIIDFGKEMTFLLALIYNICLNRTFMKLNVNPMGKVILVVFLIYWISTGLFTTQIQDFGNYLLIAVPCLYYYFKNKGKKNENRNINIL